MNYTKPTLNVLDSAIRAIQSGSDDKLESPHDSPPFQTTASAYEADE